MIGAQSLLMASTPLPASVSDPYFSNVTCLMHFDGANNSTTFTDQTGKVWNVNTGAKISTIQSIFGGASGSFPGTLGGWIETVYSSGFDLSADFTIEVGFYLTSYSASYAGLYGAAILSCYDGSPGGSPDAGWQLRINGTASSYDTINVYTGRTDLNATGLTIPLNTWHRVAITRISGVLRMFLNGVLVYTVSNGDPFIRTIGFPMRMGELEIGTYKFSFPGYLDELRITKGVGRYSANYILATSAFPNS